VVGSRTTVRTSGGDAAPPAGGSVSVLTATWPVAPQVIIGRPGAVGMPPGSASLTSTTRGSPRGGTSTSAG
jgi:hypothetical protein